MVCEIRERKAHLDQLVGLRQLDRTTQAQLDTEISQRIRQLKMMDPTRASAVLAQL